MKYKSFFSRTLSLSAIVFLLTFPVLAQDGGVGIGTTNPQATLHIKGTSFPGGSGTRTLLDENFDSYVVEQDSNQQGVGCYTDGWILNNNPYSSYTCDNCIDWMLYINSNSPNPRDCKQDATAIVKFAAAPTVTSVDISYDYRLQVYEIPDRLYVYLYNETTAQQVAVLATYQSPTPQTRVDGSYSGTQTVVAGNNYSIRFHYVSDDGWGATVDNVLVTEEVVAAPASYVFRLEDGSEGVGRVLTAGDNKGNAYWKPLGSPRPDNGSSTLSENSSKGNNESQGQVILDLQTTINDQEAVFDAQSKKIKELEEKLLH